MQRLIDISLIAIGGANIGMGVFLIAHGNIGAIGFSIMGAVFIAAGLWNPPGWRRS
jgi:hypothetical protein